ncbi:MAG: ABC transporter ATP-binding protein [Clostridium sp.]
MDKSIYSTVDIFKIPFKFAPLYASLMGIQKVLEGVVPILKMISVAKFLDTAIAIVSKKMNFNDIFTPLILLVLLITYSWVSQNLIKFIDMKLEMRLRETFRVNITEKRAKLKYNHIENNKTWDLISRVAKEPELQCKNAYKDFLSIVAMLIRIGGLLLVLTIHVWWAAAVIFIISVPLFKISLKNGEDSYDSDRKVSKYKRKFEYLEEILTGRESAEERTLFGYTDEVNRKWEEQYEIARKIEYKTDLKCYIRSRARSILTTIISITIVMILLKPLEMEMLSLGLFISITNGVFELIQMMSWQFSYYVSLFSKNKEYIKDLAEFFQLEEKEGALDKPSMKKIRLKTLEFKNVFFRYPGTESYILKNLSFVIDEGGHYAFVGVNGAGKTTITKLITGLYEEFDGEILINGKSIREYKESELKAISSVVYQDFAKYYVSFKDNIALGDVNSMSDDKQEKNIRSSMRIMDLNRVSENLTDGVETHLGKIKSHGVDLSGGQWQRIGMARSIVSRATLRILDEPTAALDPISESNIYEKFKEISKGGTTIFISHRLGSTRIANEIFVIGDGTIIEKGSHEKLMEINGVYADMYKSQRSWYL